MATTRRYLLFAFVMTMLAVAERPLFATPGQTATDRVRAGNTEIASLISQAIERSTTFRGLLNNINASDGIVYIEPGTCGHGMRACFVKVTMAGTTRILWVIVEVRGDDCDLMGLLGHELQHTIEVLSDPKVTSSSAMYLFYSQQADRRGGPAFETIAATRIGEAVRTEVREKNRCTKIR